MSSYRLATTTVHSMLIVEGELQMFEQEGGFCAAEIRVNGNQLDRLIEELLGVDHDANRAREDCMGAPDVDLSWCKITIEVLSDAKETRRVYGRTKKDRQDLKERNSK